MANKDKKTETLDFLRSDIPLPNSREAESAVLGSLMFKEENIDVVVDILRPDDFFYAENKLIFNSIVDLANKNEKIDVITVSESLGAKGVLESVGGLNALVNLVQTTPSSENVESYSKIVSEKAAQRKIVQLSNRLVGEAISAQPGQSSELLSEAEKSLYEITESGNISRGGFRDISEVLEETVDKIEVLYNEDSTITGIPTGFSEFDRISAGLQNSDLLIIAGRPAMGKTTIAINMAENIALRDKPVAIFSLEMPAVQLSMRMIASIGKVDLKDIRTGNIDEENWNNLTGAVKSLNESEIFIDDQGGLSIQEIRSRAKRLKRMQPDLSLIVIDYLQLITSSTRTGSRTEEISMISRSLKEMAKELDIPVIAISQLNRGVELRTDKRPVMSDLRESGAIEQDADMIMFVYRDEYYNPETTDKNIGELIIRKHRNGGLGTVKLKFTGHYTKYEDLDYTDWGAETEVVAYDG